MNKSKAGQKLNLRRKQSKFFDNKKHSIKDSTPDTMRFLILKTFAQSHLVK